MIAGSAATAAAKASAIICEGIEAVAKPLADPVNDRVGEARTIEHGAHQQRRLRGLQRQRRSRFEPHVTP